MEGSLGSEVFEVSRVGKRAGIKSSGSFHTEIGKGGARDEKALGLISEDKTIFTVELL